MKTLHILCMGLRRNVCIGSYLEVRAHYSIECTCGMLQRRWIEHILPHLTTSLSLYSLCLARLSLS